MDMTADICRRLITVRSRAHLLLPAISAFFATPSMHGCPLGTGLTSNKPAARARFTLVLSLSCVLIGLGA